MAFAQRASLSFNTSRDYAQALGALGVSVRRTASGWAFAGRLGSSLSLSWSSDGVVESVSSSEDVRLGGASTYEPVVSVSVSWPLEREPGFHAWFGQNVGVIF